VALPRLLEATEAVKMDELGVPNYESYYGLLRSNLELSRLEAEGKIGTLAFETSRGCWWGQKQHCTFCGLNGAQLTYREKSSDRVLSEMQELCEKYDRYDFLAVDSILSLNAFKTLLPDLISSETNFKIFSELKANLTIDQLSLLREAGFQILQPGIESLSTEVLKLMKKGVTGTQNIHLLRWAQNFGLKVLWNILYGFPGESHEAYAEALTVLPKLRHLQPPVGANRIRLDRFSPNFKRHFEGAGEFASVRPLAYYEYCFPAVWNLNNLAYSFESIAIRSAPQELYSQLEYLVKDWQKAWAEPLSRPQLIFKRALASGHVLDSRFGGPKTIELSGDYFDIACVLDKTPLTLIGLSEKLNLPAEIVDSACEELSKLDLVLKLDGRLTWLPLREPISPGF
jgi:ribosomal peptide maturation radical SAM protein 1